MTNETKVIEAPMTKTKVELKSWITGRQDEYIQEPYLLAVKVQNNQAGAPGTYSMPGEETAKAVKESAHRKIESFVAKVDEETDPKKCLELILDLPAEDYKFVQAEIEAIEQTSKKKLQA